MLTSLFSGTSGLKSNMSAMSVIGDNLANMNTIGFKTSRVSFSDLLAQNLVGTYGTNQIGLGVRVSNVSPLFNQGSLESTGSGTDLAIEGNGFFVVRDAANSTFYTRAGQFNFDKDGFMTNPQGNIAQGYGTDGLGVINNVVGDVKLSFAPIQPKSTSTMDLVANLDSDADVTGFVFTARTDLVNGNDEIEFTAGSAATASLIIDGGLVEGKAYTGVETASAIRTAMEATSPGDKFSVDYVPLSGAFKITNDAGNASTLTMGWSAATSAKELGFTVDSSALIGGETNTSDITAGEFDITNPIDTSNFSTALTVFDSLGNAHQVAVYFRKGTVASAGNTWDWYAVAEGADSASGITEVQANGSLDFSTAGALKSESVVNYPDLDPAGGGVFGFNFAGGATQNQQISFDFGDSITEGSDGLSGMTQYAQASSVFNQFQDGYTVGTLQSVAVNADGMVTGIFSNGIQRNMAQLVLGKFSSPENLKKEGGNLFKETLASGQALLSPAGTSGLGTIHSNSLELSTVDISEEFVKMITAQRGFQANSRVITTSDDMLAELVNLKR